MTAHDLIIDRFGKEKVEELKRELCDVCSRSEYIVSKGVNRCQYHLLPITTKGERCPYFKAVTP